MFVFVPTTIHIPKPLLKRVDARAKALGVSRNRVITEALETTLGDRESWPPELVRMLEEPLGVEASQLLEKSLVAVRKRRTNRRRAPEL